jgi:hypothetical protein
VYKFKFIGYYVSDMVSLDRDRGILSTSDRRYALDYERWSEGKSRAASNQRETSIIKRIGNGILDFRNLSNEEFPQELLEQVFRAPEEEFSVNQIDSLSLQQMDTIFEYHNPGVEQGCISAVELIYRMYTPNVANKIIEMGVRRAIRDFYPEYEVSDASYDPELDSPDKTHQRAKKFLEEGVTLSDEQIRVLLERGEVNPVTIAEHVQSETQSPDIDIEKKILTEQRLVPEKIEPDADVEEDNR